MEFIFYSQLSQPVKSLVDTIESYSNLKIRVELNPYPINNTDPNPNAPSGFYSSNAAIIYLRNLRDFKEHGILHLLLLLKRYWIDKIPQLVPIDNDVERFKITSSIEGVLEHLVVVPQEANYGFEPFDYWNKTVLKNWNKYPFPNLNDWARKKYFLLGWLTAANLVSDNKVRKMVESCLSKEGFLPICNRFNKEIISNLDSKEKCLSIVVEYLNIPKNEVLLRYFDVKNRKQKDVKMVSKTHEKPSGVIGWTKISVESVKQAITFLKAHFPKTKDSIELIITNAFIANATKGNQLPFQIIDIEQNKENNLDFQLHTSEGTKLLELMEVAPLEHVHNYENAPSTYKSFDFGEYILKKILGKSNKYSGIKKTGLILLIYNTDWKFTASQTLIELLQYWTLNKPHSFESIYLYEPDSDTEGMIHLIFPTPISLWVDFNPQNYKDSSVINLDPLGWKIGKVPPFDKEKKDT